MILARIGPKTFSGTQEAFPLQQCVSPARTGKKDNTFSDRGVYSLSA